MPVIRNKVQRSTLRGVLSEGVFLEVETIGSLEGGSIVTPFYTMVNNAPVVCRAKWIKKEGGEWLLKGLYTERN